MKLALVSFAAVIGIALIAICCIMSSKNGAISLEESVSTAKSGIDVQLSNRFNKLNELAECVNLHDKKSSITENINKFKVEDYNDMSSLVWDYKSKSREYLMKIK